jgi:purine-binding chemotaxis protein CheW
MSQLNGTTQYCTFLVENHFFGVDVLKVQEVFRYSERTSIPLAPPVIGGLINLRGQIITAIDLRRRLDFADYPEDLVPQNVVVRNEGGTVSLLVDEIGDVLAVSADSFEPPPNTMPENLRSLISGVHKLEGHLLLILDIEQVVDLDPART